MGLNFCQRFLSDAGPVTRDDVLRHVDHMLELGGERVVALGSDYDGCDVPEWLEPAEKVGTLYDLFAAEFCVEVAEAICFENACSFFDLFVLYDTETFVGMSLNSLSSLSFTGSTFG